MATDGAGYWGAGYWTLGYWETGYWAEQDVTPTLIYSLERLYVVPDESRTYVVD